MITAPEAVGKAERADSRDNPEFFQDASETSLIPPPSPAEDAAHAAAAETIDQVEGRVKALFAQSRGRHAKCGRAKAVFVDTTSPRRGFAGRLRCKRVDCPSCERRRVVAAMRRLTDACLRAEPGQVRPRVEVLWLWRGPWSRWGAVSKAIRRAGDKPGHARVRTAGGEVVVVSEVPFPGASPVTPSAAALALASACEAELAPVRHAARLLGRWRPIQGKKRWSRIQTRLAPEAVGELARNAGAHARLIRGGDDLHTGAVGFSFPTDVADETVDAFWERLRAARPTVARDKAWSMGKVGHEAEWRTSYGGNDTPPEDTPLAEDERPRRLAA